LIRRRKSASAEEEKLPAAGRAAVVVGAAVVAGAAVVVGAAIVVGAAVVGGARVVAGADAAVVTGTPVVVVTARGVVVATGKAGDGEGSDTVAGATLGLLNRTGALTSSAGDGVDGLAWTGTTSAAARSMKRGGAMAPLRSWITMTQAAVTVVSASVLLIRFCSPVSRHGLSPLMAIGRTPAGLEATNAGIFRTRKPGNGSRNQRGV
jgi:hypothetical protein